MRWGVPSACEHLPLLGFKKPPLAVGECLEQPPSRQSCEMSDEVSQGLPFLALISEASLSLFQRKVPMFFSRV